MQTIDEVKEHCRFVGEDIEKMVADRMPQLRSIVGKLKEICQEAV